MMGAWLISIASTAFSPVQCMFNQGSGGIGSPHYARGSGRRLGLAPRSVCSGSVCPTCPGHALSSHRVDLHNRVAFWDGFTSFGGRSDLFCLYFKLVFFIMYPPVTVTLTWDVTVCRTP